MGRIVAATTILADVIHEILLTIYSQQYFYSQQKVVSKDTL